MSAGESASMQSLPLRECDFVDLKRDLESVALMVGGSTGAALVVVSVVLWAADGKDPELEVVHGAVRCMDAPPDLIARAREQVSIGRTMAASATPPGMVPS